MPVNNFYVEIMRTMTYKSEFAQLFKLLFHTHNE